MKTGVVALHGDGAEPRQRRRRTSSLTVSNREKGKALRYKNVGAPGSVIGAGDGVQWSGTLTPARLRRGARRSTTSPATARTAATCRCRSSASAPIAGVGDDTITNFNVPTFYYGGEPYTRIGVVSNGYVVIGGGDSGDIVFIPQTFPNAARPNNVDRPVLERSQPGGVRRRDPRRRRSPTAPTTWIVVDWAGVKNFGNATTHTFEIWIRLAAGAPAPGPRARQVSTVRTAPGDGRRQRRLRRSGLRP